jgi:(R,R)-butanediol dehydrogenase / meso-butanediol dehydrogenase / diacetyl reductase
MKAMVYYGSQNAKVEEIPEPIVKPGTVKVKINYAGICGTDVHEYHDQMYVTQTPMILGHEFAGEVVEIGEGVLHYQVGDRVVVEPISGCGECVSCEDGYYNTCEYLQAYGLHQPGGFAEYVVVKENNLVLLPDSLSYELAALVEPTAVAMQAVKSSMLKIGDKVVIFGAGPIGMLITQCAKASGASQIIVVEIEQKRQQLALEMGADFVIDPSKEDAVQKIKELTARGANVAFEASGAEPAFRTALECLRPHGELMIVSVFKKGVSYSPLLQQKGMKKIHTSRAYKNIFPEVITLLGTGTLNVKPIITSIIKLEDIIELGFNKLIANKEECKILVSPE